MAKNIFNDIDYKAIGQRVRDARLKKQMTQEELAEKVGISTSYASAIETGASKVALPTLIQLANTLDTTVETLLYDVTPAAVYKYDLEAKKILEDCSKEERSFLINIMRAAREELRKLPK